MNKARKAIENRLKNIDLVIEILDARLPASCVSPLLARMAKGKKQLKILNKADLADPARTESWLKYFAAQHDTAALAVSAHDSSTAAKTARACRAALPARGGIDKPLRVLVCGVPNVGKSTFINRLIGKKSAKTGNEPGITRAEQRLFLADDFWLYDTPGMLWQKILVPESGENLAIAGSVGRNALDEETVALILLARLKADYARLLENRYKIQELNAQTPEEEWLEAIARKRGAILAGKRTDWQKAAEILLQDFRSGSLGRITLETPEQFAGWLKNAQTQEAERRRQAALRQAAKE